MVTSVKLVVLGDGGVGKTALTIRLCLNHFIEDSYRKHAIIDDQPYLLEILDTAGQGEFSEGPPCRLLCKLSLTVLAWTEDYTSLRSQWIREGDGFLVVYSTTSRSSFLRIHEFIQQITRVKDSDRVPIVLVGNKLDRINEREVDTREGQDLARRLGCEFVETSAKTREGLEQAYHTAVRLIQGQNASGQQSGSPYGAGSTSGGKGKKPKKPRKCTIV
ncbi:uncharacterized protein JCM15063_000175 [Sporobolomyces koalae]|uniref:uncharacterized protein n=1 Tax=Sporobolomyces koalae TaxID=500713 RepID=UPI0031749F7F